MGNANRASTGDLERALIENWLCEQQNPEQYLSDESLKRLKKREKASEVKRKNT